MKTESSEAVLSSHCTMASHIEGTYLYFLRTMHTECLKDSGGSGGGATPGARPPPLAAKFFSISCSFRRKKLNFIPAAPAPRVGAPPRENPGSATERYF